ncbi:CASP-like protein 2D1 [Impatiens glandulifera]|uniref:CASP-like protein 2D1 n=1 Tax=Impatiens glandulifera TaxID=253017 RepID=UPI001FB0D927|nr:CASP-like protein 2D1 [Impatiens glandulifera]XP_047340769.1 CASP-like protein 2D1 [Impatiens glandulifera]XP_047340770.1 CASP-like protein 2D1 [Impatiens glandulifera]
MNDVGEHRRRRRKCGVVVKMMIELFVRLLVIPLNVGSIWLTFTSKQDNITYGTLDFRDLLGLKYMICISVVSCVYALFAAALTFSIWIIINNNNNITGSFLTKLAWLFFIADQVIAYLTVTSTGAVGEMVYLSYHGDVKVTWSETCTTYPNFCNRIKTALILHSFTLSSFFLLPIVSAFRLFSNNNNLHPQTTTTPTFTTTNPTYTTIII